MEKNQQSQLMKLLAKYSPETTAAKKERLQAEAEARKGGNKAEHIGPNPLHLKFGLNHVTTLVEEGKAKLVVIAHDVEPVELMSFLPGLCRSKDVPYCIVKNKTTLGQLVHCKTATCVALTEVNKDDLQDFATLQKNFRAAYIENKKAIFSSSTPTMGIKNQHMMRRREKLRQVELEKKQNM